MAVVFLPPFWAQAGGKWQRWGRWSPGKGAAWRCNRGRCVRGKCRCLSVSDREDVSLFARVSDTQPYGPPCKARGSGGTVRWRGRRAVLRRGELRPRGRGRRRCAGPAAAGRAAAAAGPQVGKSFRGGGHGGPRAVPPVRERSPGPGGGTETCPQPRAGRLAGGGDGHGGRSRRGARAAHLAPGSELHGRGGPRGPAGRRASPCPALCVCVRLAA